MRRSRLTLADLRIEGPDGVLVDDAGLVIDPGRITVLVGASGSGKSLTTRSLLGMTDPNLRLVRADLRVEVDGVEHDPYDTESLADRRLLEGRFRPLRGPILGYMPQNAQASLEPLWTVGAQVVECLELKGEEEPDPHSWLARAGFKSPERVAKLYPHELSGGMAQRASIALALARGSRFLLADEPTTGLDPTVQDAILEEIFALKKQGVGILFITHDLRLVPRMADRLLVMHQGRIVEHAEGNITLQQMTSAPAKALWAATERIAGRRS